MKVGLVTSKPSETNPNGKLFQMIGLNLRTGALFNIIISNVCISGTPGERVLVNGENKVISKVEYKEGKTTYIFTDNTRSDNVKFVTKKINPKEGEVYFFEESQGYAKLIKPFVIGEYLVKKIIESKTHTEQELQALRVNAFLESKSLSFVNERDQVVFENGVTVPLYSVMSKRSR